MLLVRVGYKHAHHPFESALFVWRIICRLSNYNNYNLFLTVCMMYGDYCNAQIWYPRRDLTNVVVAYCCVWNLLFLFCISVSLARSPLDAIIFLSPDVCPYFIFPFIAVVCCSLNSFCVILNVDACCKIYHVSLRKKNCWFYTAKWFE